MSEEPVTPPTIQEQKAQELSAMLTKIKQAKSIVDLDLTGWDQATRPGMEVAKNNAKDTLAALSASYRSQVYSNSAVLLVTSSVGADPAKVLEQTEALENAATAMGAIVIDASKVYRAVATNIESKLGPERRLLVDFVLDIERQVADICSLFGVNGSFLRVANRYYDSSLPTFNDVVQVVRDTFRNGQPDFIQSLGETLSVLAARAEFYGTCESVGVAEVPTAVMVSRLQPEEVAGFQTFFMPGRPFTTFEADKVKSPDKALEKAAGDLLKKLGMSQ